jgi:hypothetical protein
MGYIVLQGGGCMKHNCFLALILVFVCSDYNSIWAADLTLPLRATFYYPWFPATWTVNGKHVFYQPDLGYYSSDNLAVVDQHIRALDYANIDVALASWWGVNQNSENTRIPLLLNRTVAAGSDLKWAVYYEKEGFGNPTVAQIQSDLAYLNQHYTSHQSYAHINGKPVIFVYNADDNSCEVADRWVQATSGAWYLSLKVVAGFTACVHQPTTWHQYGPDSPQQRHNGYSFVIAPGFWRADEASPRLARDTARWSLNVRNMVASREPWQLVTTFSEWGEGTAVEGAREWTSASGYGTYLDALHTNGGTSSIINRRSNNLDITALSMAKNVDVDVYDLQGKLIKTLKNRTVSSYSLDPRKNGLARGIYFLKLNTEKSWSLSKKIVVY